MDFDAIGTYGTYKVCAGAYLAKHNPTRMGSNSVGIWYEHPIYGDEVGMLVVPTGTDKILLTYWYDVPTDEELGVSYTLV